MLKVMDGFKYLFAKHTTPLKWARNLGLSLTNSAVPLKQLIIQYAMGLKGDLPRLANINT